MVIDVNGFKGNMAALYMSAYVLFKKPEKKLVDKGMNSGCRVLRVGVVLFMAIFLAVNVVKSNPENLRSLVGLVGFIVLLFLFSQNPARVKSCIYICIYLIFVSLSHSFAQCPLSQSVGTSWCY